MIKNFMLASTLVFAIITQTVSMDVPPVPEQDNEIRLSASAVEAHDKKLKELDEGLKLLGKDLKADYRLMLPFTRTIKEVAFIPWTAKAQGLTSYNDKLKLFLQYNSKDINKFLKLGKVGLQAGIINSRETGDLMHATYGGLDSNRFSKIINEFYDVMEKLPKLIVKSNEDYMRDIVQCPTLSFIMKSPTIGPGVINYLWYNFEILINFDMLKLNV